MHIKLRQLAFLTFILICVAGSFVKGQDQQPLLKKDSLTFRLKVTLVGHTKKVETISFSENGDQIETSSKDGTVRFWDSQTGELKSTISGADKKKWGEKRFQAIRGRYYAANIFPTRFRGQLKIAIADEERMLAISPDGRTILTSKLRE